MNNYILRSIVYIYFWFLIIFLNSTNAQKIFFTLNQSGEIEQSDLNGSNLNTLLTSSKGLYGIAIDLKDSIIFYTNVHTDEIIKSNLKDTNSNIILSASNNSVDGPRGIAVDGNNNKIYWVENGSNKLRSANLDGTDVMDILTGLNAPVDVALDLPANKIYWSENEVRSKRIRRCNFDGSNIEDVISGIDQAGGICVDSKAGKIYWVDFGSEDRIMAADTNGTNIDTLLIVPNGSPRGIAVDNENNNIFWTDVLLNTINKANMNSTFSTAIVSNLNSPVGIDNNWVIAVPVELTSFNASVLNNSVRLNWTTATEINNYGFEIERSSVSSKQPLVNWEKVGFIKGNGTTSEEKNYSFIDKNPTASNEFYYRLKQIDIDGTFKYSNQINVDITPNKFELFQNYPNPFNPATTIKFSIANESQVRIVVFNVIGQEIKELTNKQYKAGYYQLNFDAGEFPSGVYYYRIQSVDLSG